MSTTMNLERMVQNNRYLSVIRLGVLREYSPEVNELIVLLLNVELLEGPRVEDVLNVE